MRVPRITAPPPATEFDDAPLARQSTSTGRLRIAYVHDGLYPYFKGGAERRFSQVAQELSSRHEVTYVTWQYWDGPALIEKSDIRFLGVGRPQDFYGDDGKRKVGEAASFAKGVAGVLKRERFDVIDCCATAIPALYATSLFGHIRKTPVVATWHEYWGDYWASYLPERKLLGRLAKSIESRSVRLADSIIAVSEFTAAKLRGHAKQTPIHTIENGVDLRAIDAVETEPNAPDVLFAGRLIDDKKVDLLLEAVARLSKEHPSLTCGIVGEGPERANLEALARSLGISHRVRFYGFVEESRLYGIMKGARLFALPSIREGFGIAVVEAQACGAVPIVVRAPYNAATALVRHEHDGLICAAGVEGLTSAIRRLSTDQGLCLQLSANARNAASTRDWRVITGQIEEVYRSVVTHR
jgi:glycosyltransferase involved in cell wall biosynthesis